MDFINFIMTYFYLSEIYKNINPIANQISILLFYHNYYRMSISIEFNFENNL